MLELVFLIWFYGKLASMAERKHRTSRWGWFGVAAWIVGGALGGVVGALAGVIGWGLYFSYLIGAAVGAWIAYVRVSALTEGIELRSATGHRHDRGLVPNRPMSQPTVTRTPTKAHRQTPPGEGAGSSAVFVNKGKVYRG